MRGLFHSISFGRKGLKTRKNSSDLSGRLIFFRIFIVFFAGFLGVRLFDLQILSHAEYKAAADGEHKFFRKLIPNRGEIYLHDRKGDSAIGTVLGHTAKKELVFPAVTNREYATIYAIPKTIREPEKVAEQLAMILELDKEALLARLSKKDDPYEILKKKISDETIEAIQALDITGIGFITSSYRFYPEKGVGGHIFGYVGYNGDTQRGLYGLEGYFQDILKGKEGSLHLETDARGALIPIGERRVVEAVDGSDLILTIDRTIQLVTCDRLKSWVVQHGADGGSVIIMDPETGAILAMCATPD